jgi:tRNA A-37 threonylcarbamoyl transferase component Bud32
VSGAAGRQVCDCSSLLCLADVVDVDHAVWEITGMDPRYTYLLHCLADRDFYDHPERWDDVDSSFSHTGRLAPAGWGRVEQGVWIGLHPRGVRLPPQGWKIHVSACLEDAENVLDVVWNYCVTHNITFKFLRSRGILLVTTSKYADRASSGKLLTLYPVGDAELERTLVELATALERYRGPYILSDLRWGSGPLYVRYGAFLDQYCSSETGDLVPAITNPDGRLVPDLRRPVFQVPPWVEVPAFLAAQMASRESGRPENFPYQIEQPLHFSNGGGVYLARDMRSGQRVVLKEARPLAGLDDHGIDAVTRLERERTILEQLCDLDIVPRLLGQVMCWEHHFLIQEYVEGELLTSCIDSRHPLYQFDPTEDQTTKYTAWALDVLGRIEEALDALHQRGIVFSDLHPHNIIVRPDGRIVFVDFEVASHIDENRRPGLGAPGFVAPASCSGFDIDHYALSCLHIWMFLPLTTILVQRDPTKAKTFVRVLTEQFDVPETLAVQVLRSLSLATNSTANGERMRPRGAAQQPTTTPTVRLDAENPDWTTLRKSMIEAIIASATLQRPDRLFPGDIGQFHYGGLNLAYGAAGVLYALHTTGAGTHPEHVDWLVHATRQAQRPHAGLYNGLHGIAYVLDYLGRRNEALTILDRALTLTADVRARGLFGGLAGIGLNLLHFARTTEERSLRETAIQVAEQLVSAVHDRTATPDLPSSAGLMYGLSGAALLFIHLYEDTADKGFLDLAAAALRQDLSYCEHASDGTLQVREGRRLLPYLAVGSAGIGLVLCEYLRYRDDEEFASAQAAIRRACQSEFVLFSGLFTGRAGLMVYLCQVRNLMQETGRDAALQLHLRRLTWHALPYQGYVAFPGDQMLRLSMDLATGSAGVLLTIHAVLDEIETFLPFLKTSKHCRPTDMMAEERR